MAIAETIKDYFQIRIDDRRQYLLRYGVDPLLFLRLFLGRSLKTFITSVKADDMNEFMRRNVKQQGGQLDKSRGPLYGIENTVVLQANPVEIEVAFPVIAFFWLIMVPAEVCEGPVIDLMFFEVGQGLDIVA